MTNDESKAFWLKHGKKPRIQARLERRPGEWSEWQTLMVDPKWYPDMRYRIHPEDLEKFTMQEQPKLDVTKPLQYTANKDLQVVFLSEMTEDDGDKRLLFKLTNKEGVDSLMDSDLDGNAPFGTRVVNPPQVLHEEWRAVYGIGLGWAHESLDAAKRNMAALCRGFIKITTFTDGTFTVEKVEDTTPTV